MFKNRAMQVKIVKDSKEQPTQSGTTTGHWHIEYKDVRDAVIVGFTGIAALKVIDAACDVVKIYAAK